MSVGVTSKKGWKYLGLVQWGLSISSPFSYSQSDIAPTERCLTEGEIYDLYKRNLP